jgi:NAD(P)-dependent dehydrogenase (short-subunit alcohol dehydrogenase family)
MSATNQRVALITGGNRGLGLQTARELKDQGIVVILGARNLSNGEAAAPILLKEGIEADAVRLDVTDASTHAEAFDVFESRYGQLDILIQQRRSLEGECLREQLCSGHQPDQLPSDGNSAGNL